MELNERMYQLALTMVPNIGDVQARLLVQHFKTASAIFGARPSELERMEGIGAVRARSIKQFNDFSAAEKELEFIEKYQIQMLFVADEQYPKRLLNCYDAPPLLFYRGAANLNSSRVLAIVGTRSATDYGRQLTEQIVQDLSGYEVVIVSGLALGIDAHAHRAALKCNLPTVGVVGHGLDKIYPHAHTKMAREMVLAGGGILSEFFSGTLPDKHNFPLRNRIVAGLSDATIVVETDVKGGSMITAKMADAYNRDVFAVPGRSTDPKSSGCNYLIQHQKALLINNAEDLLEAMGWKDKNITRQKQRELFIEFTEEEKKLVHLLREGKPVPIDEINLQSGLSSSTVAATLLNLELKGVIVSMPGKMYRLS
jgi:DNA processing protein